MTVLAYLLMYYCVLLGVGLASDSTGWHATVITVGNVSVNFLIPWLLSRPSVYGNRSGPVAVWAGDIVAVLVVDGSSWRRPRWGSASTFVYAGRISYEEH